jgi:PRA1 family protein 1
MAQISIPLDAITNRFNLSDRFNSIRSQSIASRFSNVKPISEFLDLKRLSKPADFGEVQSRVNYNLAYFSSNYAVVFVMLSIYSLITRPILLFLIVLVFGGMWCIRKLGGADLDIGVFRATSSQLYTALVCVAVPLTFYASPITTFLWLIGASAVSILGHAALMDRPIENAFSEEAV